MISGGWVMDKKQGNALFFLFKYIVSAAEMGAAK